MAKKNSLTDEAIEDALIDICGGGRDYQECSCGRVFFNESYREELDGEPTLDELRRLAREHSDKYTEVGYSIAWLCLFWNGGRRHDVVIGCPCKAAIKVARRWLIDAPLISDFFTKCARIMEEESEAHRRISNQVSGAIKKIRNR